MAKSAKKPVSGATGRQASPKSSKSSKASKTPRAAKATPTSKAKKPHSKAKPAPTPKALSPKSEVKSIRQKSSRPGRPVVDNSFKPGSAGPLVIDPLPQRAPPPPPPERVTTDTKPKRNQAGLSQRELEHFRSLLLEKRREILGDMSSMEREALRSAQGSNLSNMPVHMADMGTDNYEQEFTLGLVEKDRQLLREINAALAKIQAGTYGLCEATGKPISKPRLEAQPWARHSIEYAREMEKRQMRR